MNYWLAQANPTKFPIIDYYAKYGNRGTQNTWHSAYAGKVREGDKVFCFKSKGHDRWRGILSSEEVTCDATKATEEFPYEEILWIDKKEQERLNKQWGFTTRTLIAFPYNPIKEDDFNKYPETRGLKVPTRLLVGIRQLTMIQGKNLEDLIKRIRCQC